MTRLTTPSMLAALSLLTAAFSAAAAQPEGLLPVPGVTRVRAYSTADGHEPIDGLAGSTAAVIIDDFVLRASGEPGLNVVTSRSGSVQRDFFRLARANTAVDRLTRLVDAAPPGTMLAMSVYRAATPAGEHAEAASAAARELFARLGAEICPLDAGAASWAYVGVRLSSGWVRAAESFSTSQGVSASFVFSDDLERYQNHEAHLLTAGPITLSLLDRWTTASPMPNTTLAGEVTLGERPLPAVLAHPPFGADLLAQYPHGENRLILNAIPLGSACVFQCSLGMAPDAYGKTDGVTYTLLVNGREEASRTFSPNAADPHAWHDWSVDLGEYAGQTVSLELRIGPNEATYFDQAYWGAPRVTWGAVPAKSAAPEDAHRLVFVGHAYPFNGVDKRCYASYLGWNTTDETYQAGGSSVKQRILTELSRFRTEFFEGVAARRPNRIVWGGDSVYTAIPESVEGFSRLLIEMQPPGTAAANVVLAGNHDPHLGRSGPLQALCAAPPDGDETIAGLRLLYVDTTRSGDRSIVTDTYTCGPDEPWIEQLLARIETAAADPGVYGVVLLMHHAPWLSEPGVANVAHDSNQWWMQRVHPALAALAEKGIAAAVLAGDAGDFCFADGRTIEGVQYAVSGQPRVDSSVPNGFVELAWGPSQPGLKLRIHTWRPGQGFRVYEPTPGESWRY